MSTANAPNIHLHRPRRTQPTASSTTSLPTRPSAHPPAHRFLPHVLLMCCTCRFALAYIKNKSPAARPRLASPCASPSGTTPLVTQISGHKTHAVAGASRRALHAPIRGEPPWSPRMRAQDLCCGGSRLSAIYMPPYGEHTLVTQNAGTRPMLCWAHPAACYMLPCEESSC